MSRPAEAPPASPALVARLAAHARADPEWRYQLVLRVGEAEADRLIAGPGPAWAPDGRAPAPAPAAQAVPLAVCPHLGALQEARDLGGRQCNCSGLWLYECTLFEADCRLGPAEPGVRSCAACPEHPGRRNPIGRRPPGPG